MAANLKLNNKVCFVHVSREGKNPSIKLMPRGMIGIADYLSKNSFKPSIIHLGLEKSLNPSFDLKNFVISRGYWAVLFDLHWYQHTYEVLEAIKYLKRGIKKITVIVGGMTASLFATEIMRTYKEIDFVIKGDAEIPLLALLNSIRSKSPEGLRLIPNLVWRDGEGIVENPHTYVAGKAIINRLSYANFKLIRNHDKYIRFFSMDLNNKDSEPIFYYTASRGCVRSCSFCGGGCSAQKNINKRSKIVFADVKYVIKDLKRLKKYNINKLHMYAVSQNDAYFMDLFKEIRKNKIDLTINFGDCRLSTKVFIDEFAKTFQRGSIISIFLESGSRKIRKMNKEAGYSNNEILEILLYANKKNLKLCLSFSAGLPFETKKNIYETLKFINSIRNRLANVEIRQDSTAIDPASPLFLYPEKYGVLSKVNSLKDFYNFSKSNLSVIPYCTEFFSEADISEILKLYHSEIYCIYKKSKYLAALTQSRLMVDNLNLNLWRGFCRECGQYNRCFNSNSKQ
ncbi:MAG: radical SAM protein [Candidatus Omnitrophota bacterium]|nr:radical SAM protein [Candidatus Omnitrophota bacterium]